MKLVIVKAKIIDKIDVLKKISDTGHQFGKVVFQNDRIFLPRGYQVSRNLPKMMIRTEIIDPKRKPWYQMIQKRHIDTENVDLVHSTPVLNYTEAAHIVQQLGFELKAEVIRNRQKLQIEDTVIYLDDVDELGSYIKIEREAKKGQDIEKVREELWDVLRVFGVDESQAEPDTYTAQILKLKK